MVNPIDTLKKLKGRSWTELRTRSEQALAVYSEQIGLGSKVPSDREFGQLLNRASFGKGKITPEIVFERFYQFCPQIGFFRRSATRRGPRIFCANDSRESRSVT